MSDSERTPFRSVTCIGIGNAFRRDDGVGLVVAQTLKAKQLPATTVVEMHDEGASLMELWKDTDAVILIDAVSSGGKPGTVYRLNSQQQTLPPDFFHYSTHAFSVAEAIELARMLDELPHYAIVYGIEGADFDHGIGLSESVQAAVYPVVEQIKKEITALTFGTLETDP